MKGTPERGGAISAQLRADRRRLLETARTSVSPLDLVGWQRELADALTEAERSRSLKPGEFRRHAARCRLIADEVVWRHLHPHAIRIYSWWRHPRPGLVHQESALALALEVAATFAGHRVPALVTDLTSHLTSGDLLAVLDRERPVIIECKARARPTEMPTGPTRQVQRYLLQAQHIRRGGRHDPSTGADHPILSLAGHDRTSAGALAAAVRIATKKGQGLVVVPPHEAYWAAKLECEPSPKAAFEQIERLLPAARTPTIATTIEMNNEPDPRWPPPSFWLTDIDDAQAVLEGDVAVVRYADLGPVLDAIGQGAVLAGDRIIQTDEDGGIEWLNIVGEVMGGFLSIDSAVAKVSAAKEMAAAEMSISEPELDERRRTRGEDPIGHTTLTLDELRSLPEAKEVLAGQPLVIFAS